MSGIEKQDKKKEGGRQAPEDGMGNQRESSKSVEEKNISAEASIGADIGVEESIGAEEKVQKEKNTVKEGDCEANKEGGKTLKAAINKETEGEASKSLVELDKSKENKATEAKRAAAVQKSVKRNQEARELMAYEHHTKKKMKILDDAVEEVARLTNLCDEDFEEKLV